MTPGLELSERDVMADLWDRHSGKPAASVAATVSNSGGGHRHPSYELQLNRQDREIKSLQSQIRKLEAQYANLSADLQQLRRESPAVDKKEQLTDKAEIAYFKPRIEAGEIDGDIYNDQEIWVDSDSLQAYRMTMASD